MKSIRLSLMVYFLILLTLSMGAVSALVYRSMSGLLLEKQQQAETAIEVRHEARCKEIRDALDRRLLVQAQSLSGVARSLVGHHESLYPLGIIGALALPNSYLTVPGWLAEATNPYLVYRLRALRPIEIQLENGDDLVPIADEDQPREFFQTFRLRGTSMQVSESLGEHRLKLSAETLDSAKTLQPMFEDLELAAGKPVRCVVLRVPVTKFRANVLPWLWRMPPPPPPRGIPGKDWRPGTERFPFGRIQPPVEGSTPEFLIAYASELGERDRQIQLLVQERDAELNDLEQSIQAGQARLRKSLIWIFVLTSAGLLVGGYWLLHFGLAPLKSLSEAVSQVSPKNFSLPIDASRLPAELQPIADRLARTLNQLRLAFEREKQAAADISHELRTPLAALLTTLEVGLRKERSNIEYKELLEECELSGRQMSHLVERLLALARLDAGVDLPRPRDVDVADLALECADGVRPLVRSHGLKLDTDVEAPLCVRVDPDKVREILNNLLHNAIEYNKPHGSIHLLVQRDTSGLLLEVRDTGIGIAPEARSKIFERFYRADPSRHADTPHAGLGLSIIKTYIDLMQGSIEVESSPAGSTFRVRLPVEETSRQIQALTV